MAMDNRRVVTAGHGAMAEAYAVDSKVTAKQQEQIAELIHRFLADDYKVRTDAARQIESLGMVAEPQLRTAMRHEDAEIRVISAN